jgi:hypothetical protein
MAKTWDEKFESAPAPSVSVLNAPTAGLMSGQKLFIASPELIDKELRKIRRGRTRTVKEIRARLAKEHGADGTCPLTTGIFLRIVAERGLAKVKNGGSISRIAPFWRAIEPGSGLSLRLSCGPDFIREQRREEEDSART